MVSHNFWLHLAHNAPGEVSRSAAVDRLPHCVNESETGVALMTVTGPTEGELALIERARSIAERAHEGQVDKAGQPYITHPARVVAKLEGDPEAVMVGWLHDVIEDTDVTLADLEAAGMPSAVVAAVEAMSKRQGEPKDDYLRRVAVNPLARHVKIDGDMADNTDPSRLARLDPETRTRLEAKYRHAAAILNQTG